MNLNKKRMTYDGQIGNIYLLLLPSVILQDANAMQSFNSSPDILRTRIPV